MKFDTAIIGGGLSGLIAGIKLSQQGQRCVIISSGQSALYFSSGSFDLLNALPNGEEVKNPIEAIDELIKQSPRHPYAKLGKDKFKETLFEAENFFKELKLNMQGTAKQNHYRITPLGILKPTWLTMNKVAVSNTDKSLPWKKVAIFNIIGFLDAFPQFLADEFLKLGTESVIRLFDLPVLDHLRKNPSEFRSTNIARELDKNIDELIKLFNDGSKDCDAIIFPACVGLEQEILLKLQISLNKPVLLIPTMPPSVIGIHIQRYLYHYFKKLGGVFMIGDSVKKADIKDNRVTALYSYNHGDIPFIPQDVIIATGSYFSQGLIAESDRVYEPIFNLDVDYDADRNEWFSHNIFERQGYQKFGVKTDTSFRGLLNGKAIENLYVAGAILEGFCPINEGCGAGVSILSSLTVADNILSK